MWKQILAMFVIGFVQSEFWGIWFGLNDTVASTITMGFDLEMDREGKHMLLIFGFLSGKSTNQTDNW